MDPGAFTFSQKPQVDVYCDKQRNDIAVVSQQESKLSLETELF